MRIYLLKTFIIIFCSKHFTFNTLIYDSVGGNHNHSRILTCYRILFLLLICVYLNVIFKTYIWLYLEEKKNHMTKIRQPIWNINFLQNSHLYYFRMFIVVLTFITPIGMGLIKIKHIFFIIRHWSVSHGASAIFRSTLSI